MTTFPSPPRPRPSRRRRGARLVAPLVALSLGALVVQGGCGGTSGGDAADDESGEPPTGGGEGTHAHTNRLAREKSPYLLQHAHNPVDWYPWGEEALERSRSEGKPIFLSVGYSTCHWCHVMERESFENEEIAALMNEYFVNIKVDREERPDVDKLYMGAVQAMTGRGGWPMSVFMTPELVPFFAGTYFPPTDQMGRAGFASLVTQLGEAWRANRADIVEHAARVRQALEDQPNQILTAGGGGALDASVLDEAYRGLAGRFDAARGGFGGAPKFPTPHQISFLFRYAHRTGEAHAIEMARRTLDEMAMGGIHDHLGGGFHRYSTDPNWLVPHFEKMLYDQAGLALAYTDAWLVTGEKTYRTVAEGILEYVLAYLTDPAGGFHSAEDADSEGREGTFYVWSPVEIDEVLGANRGAAFRETYGVTSAGNFEGENILNVKSIAPLDDPELAADRAKLLAHRDRRIRPHLDDKVITGWNGFMIEAFARAGRAFGDARYVEAGARAATFVHENLRSGSRLLRHYRKGPAAVGGYLNDYAYYGRGLVALYEASFEPKWIERAIEVASGLTDLFGHEAGPFVFYGNDSEKLLTPIVEVYDGAMPSGNSAATVFLARLGHLVADPKIEQRAYDALSGLSGALAQSPLGLLELASALDFTLGPVTEVVIAGDDADPVVRSMQASLQSRYMPNTVLAYRPLEERASIVALIPYLEAQVAIGGVPTAYVCRDYACKLPVHDVEGLARQLAEN